MNFDARLFLEKITGVSRPAKTDTVSDFPVKTVDFVKPLAKKESPVVIKRACPYCGHDEILVGNFKTMNYDTQYKCRNCHLCIRDIQNLPSDINLR